MKSRVVKIIFAVVLLTLVGSSGWIYNAWRAGRDARAYEQVAAQTAFVQQYGNKAVIKRWITSERVYAALWTSEDGTVYMSWNIGGLWVKVYDSSTPVTPQTTEP